MYSWGGLTSGSSARALWLLLLPFALVNVAADMFVAEGHDPEEDASLRLRAVSKARRALADGFPWRVFGVSLTATLVLGAVGSSMDLIVWQCGNRKNNACVSQHWQTRFLGDGFFDA